MKTISITIAVLFLAGCSGMGMSGPSHVNSMGSGSDAGYSSTPTYFDARDPYHGG